MLGCLGQSKPIRVATSDYKRIFIALESVSLYPILASSMALKEKDYPSKRHSLQAADQMAIQ